MTDREFEAFITKFLNEVKVDSEERKKLVLDGGLDLRIYDRI